MRGNMHRIAINFGTGYVAGLNAVVTGAMLAARQLGWTVVGIRDGFDGLMFPDRYPGGGLVELHASMTENMDQDLGAVRPRSQSVSRPARPARAGRAVHVTGAFNRSSVKYQKQKRDRRRGPVCFFK